MKKGYYVGLMALSLAAVVFFLVLAGGPFIQMQSGPVPMTGSFGEYEGKYGAYEAAWPVASYGAEYYSGDQDRISRWGYIIYDEERQEFLNVITSDSDHSRIGNLLYKANNGSKVTPVTVRGTVVALDDAQVEKLLNILTGSDSKTTREMDLIAFSQDRWYSIEHKKIQGLGAVNLWFCIITAAVNLMIFLIALKGFLKKKEGKEDERAILEKDFSGSKMDQLLALQKLWLSPWHDYLKKKGTKTVIGGMLLGAVIPVALGFFVKASLTTIMTIHLPVGLLMGDLLLWVQWMSLKFSLNTDKILKSFRKQIGKALPSKDDQEEMAADILEGAKDKSYRERSSQNMSWVTVGKRYWIVFHSLGGVRLVDSNQVARVETATETGQYYTGKVRITYTTYVARIYFKDSAKKKGCDYELGFDGEDTLGFLIAQIKKNLGDSIEITAV